MILRPAQADSKYSRDIVVYTVFLKSAAFLKVVKLHFWISLVSELKDYVKARKFIPRSVLKSDETGLFWMKMPKKMFIMLEGKTLSGYKLMEYRLLFCCVIMVVVI